MSEDNVTDVQKININYDPIRISYNDSYLKVIIILNNYHNILC